MTRLRSIPLLAMLALVLATTACSSGSPQLAGIWASSDGTPDKVISDSGQCSGMYYHNGKPLDIGGPMHCTLGEAQEDETYRLVVQQSPNQTSYSVTFTGNDTMELSQNGQTIVVLTRQ